MHKQATRKINFNLNIVEPINFDLLDDWLTSILKIDIKDTNTLKPAEALVKKKLLFIRSLFQAILLPCFDEGEILKLKQNLKIPSKWSVQVAIVNLDNVPNILYQTVIDFAIKNTQWMMENPKITQNIKYLYGIIQKDIINKFKRMIGSGKSTMPMLRVAHQEDIPFFYLGGGTYQLGYGAKSIQINRSTCNLDSNIGAKMSNNKILTSNLIRMAGLPAPTNGVTSTIQQATVIANKIGWPIVVKPVDADRGEGVSVGITNLKQLKIAFKEALRFSRSKNIIIEKEVKGVAHRILIANNKLLYVIKRLPKSIEGDGIKSVKQLIQDANKIVNDNPPWLRDKIYPNDNEAILVMKKSGFTLNSIPKDKELVTLRMINSTASGGTFKDLTQDIHPDNIDISIRAAKLFGLGIAGIDIITTDIKKSWYETGAIINEVNLAPLLGRNEISKKKLCTFYKYMMKSNGRIPISVFIGEDKAMSDAIKEQNSLIKQGIACYLTSHKVTISEYKNEMILPFISIYKRCKALLLNAQVQSIILVVQTDELLYTGLPIDKINIIAKIEEDLISSKNRDKKLSQDRVKELVNLIDGFKG